MINRYSLIRVSVDASVIPLLFDWSFFLFFFVCQMDVLFHVSRGLKVIWNIYLFIYLFMSFAIFFRSLPITHNGSYDVRKSGVSALQEDCTPKLWEY